jgi:hypothetical protein
LTTSPNAAMDHSTVSVNVVLFLFLLIFYVGLKNFLRS